MSRDELDLIRGIVEYAYLNDDDYVNWTYVCAMEQILKENENDSTGSNGRPC